MTIDGSPMEIAADHQHDDAPKMLLCCATGGFKENQVVGIWAGLGYFHKTE